MIRKLGIATAAVLVVMIALFTGASYVYFFMYLGVVTIGLAYLVARRGLSNLEAGSWLDRHQATVGDVLTVTYTLRSLAHVPKPWLEIHNPSTLPVAIPGRAISLGGRTARTWAARVPLTDRGQYRIDPMVVRTGDPFGLFESMASVGPGSSVLVHPPIEALPAWRLPPVRQEGSAARSEYSATLTPLVTSVRPYTTGDSFNRIHWRSSARHQELQVKEFDIERTADLWIFLDLERIQHGGTGVGATIETSVRVAAAISAHALAADRSVGMEGFGLRRAVITADRGPRQQQKIMTLLAVAQPEGTTPLAELLLESGSRLRRGAIALVITPSLDQAWVKPLAAIRSAGVSPTACIVDPLAHAQASLAASGQTLADVTARQPFERDLRALRHALDEHDVVSHVILPSVPLGEQLVSRAERRTCRRTPVTGSRFDVLVRPPQGWSSLLLLLCMVTVVGISIADARPVALVDGGDSQTGSLVILMVAAGLTGYVLARSSLGIVRSHVLGATSGAIVLLLLLGAAVGNSPTLLPFDVDELGRRMVALNAQLGANMSDWAGGSGGVPVVAFMLVLGAIGWTTGQFGAFSIFRYDRAGPAVVGSGLLLFLNVATEGLRDEAELLPAVPVLALYSAFAMLLIMRLRLVQQREQWARRQIADTADVTRLFLRSGSIFVLIAVVGASSLAATAVTRAPEVDLDDIGGPLEDVAETVSRFLAIFAVPMHQAEASTFADTFRVADSWDQGGGIAFTAQVASPLGSADGADMAGNYFWGGAYDRFDGRSWERAAPSESTYDADARLPSDAAAGNLERLQRMLVITPDDSALARGTLLGLSEAVRTDRKVTARTVSADRGLADIRFVDPIGDGESYTVASRVHDYHGDDPTLTADRLRAAGSDYPSWVRTRYLQTLPRGSVPRTLEMAARVEAASSRTRRRDNPYDKALMVQGLLGAMDYTTDITGLCGDLITPECLLEYEQGFCQQFATTMAMVLREMGIPSRLVQGFLPGTRIGEDGYEVPNQALHAWVEVYFPGSGWVRFDPTPSDVVGGYGQEITAFPERPGPDEETPDLGPRTPPDAETTPEPTSAASAGTIEGPTAASGGGGSLQGVLTAVTLIALAVLGLLLLGIYRLRRLPTLDANAAYRGITSLAARLGYGPLPTQTDYEYASRLGDSLPSVRDDLYLVAQIRVESAYGQHDVDDARLRALKRAYARIRTALLRLLVRRPD